MNFDFANERLGEYFPVFLCFFPPVAEFGFPDLAWPAAINKAKQLRRAHLTISGAPYLLNDPSHSFTLVCAMSRSQLPPESVLELAKKQLDYSSSNLVSSIPWEAYLPVNTGV